MSDEVPSFHNMNPPKDYKGKPVKYRGERRCERMFLDDEEPPLPGVYFIHATGSFYMHIDEDGSADYWTWKNCWRSEFKPGTFEKAEE